MKKAIIVVVAVVLAGLLAWAAKGCGDQESATPETVAKVTAEPVKPGPMKAEPASAGLALDSLKNATYKGIEEQDPVTLKDGAWEGEPFVEGGSSRPSVHFVRDFLLLGDIDEDGTDEAAVLLRANSGGTGENTYMAVVHLQDGRLDNLDTVLIGDRIQVRKGGFGDKYIFLEIVRPGPEDAMCCPGEVAMLGWRLENDALVPLEVTSKPRRLSLDLVGEDQWVLRWLDRDERAPAEPEITLAFKDGRLGGNSGCNSYSAAANIGDKPGDLTMGPAGGTRKMCSADVMALEQRFLSQMGQMTRYGFEAGMLALTYDFDGTPGVMLFERR